MENIFNTAMIFGFSLILLLWAGHKVLNHKLIDKFFDKLSDDAALCIISAVPILLIVFLCLCIWFLGEQSKDNKGFFTLLLCLSLGLTSVAVYSVFLTRQQIKMEENINGYRKEELEKLDRRIKTSEFVINHAWIIGITAIVAYFVIK